VLEYDPGLMFDQVSKRSPESILAMGDLPYQLLPYGEIVGPAIRDKGFEDIWACATQRPNDILESIWEQVEVSRKKLSSVFCRNWKCL